MPRITKPKNLKVVAPAYIFARNDGRGVVTVTFRPQPGGKTIVVETSPCPGVRGEALLSLEEARKAYRACEAAGYERV